MRRPTWREAIARRPTHVLVWAVAAGLAGVPAEAALGVAVALRAARAATPALALAAALALVGGGVLGDARRSVLEHHTLPIGQEVRGAATLLAAPRTDPQGGTRALADLRVVGGGAGRVLLRSDDPRALRGTPGAELAVAGRLRPSDRGARAVHAHATVTVHAARPTGGRRGGPAGLVDGVRDRAMRSLAAGIRADDGALLQGMVLGQDAGLPEALRDDLRAAGLAHLVAASGQNVLLLAALGLGAGALLGLPVRPRLVLVAGLVVLYVPLAGAGPSIQRAGVMGVAGLAAALAGRPAARWHAVGLAAAVTLVLDPRAVQDPGWQMSFAAVAALALLAAPLTAWLHRRAVPRGIAEAAAVALVATAATAPVAAWHFDRTALLSVPANVVVAPAVAPLMWLGMLAGAAAQVSPSLAASLTAAAAPLVAWVRATGTTVAGLPGASVGAPAWLVAVTAGAVLVPLAAVGARHAQQRRAREDAEAGIPHDPVPRPTARVRRRARLAAAAAGTALLAAWATVLRPPAVLQPPAPGVLRLTFLDVGQGDATLVQAGDSTALVDTGPPGADVAALLRRAGVRRLDALVVSHDALDHHGGTAAVLRVAPPALVLDGGEIVRRAPGRRLMPSAGQVVRLGPLTLRVLWPPAGPAPPETDPNDRAVVLEAEAFGTRALLPADAESAVLAPLALRAPDVLKVSHHGSADEGLPALLARLRPQVAVVSAGRRNRYGHPAPATLGALQVVPRVARTDRDGTVVVEGRGGRLAVGTGS